MKYLIFLLLPFTTTAQSCLKADIMLLVDVSGSIQGHESDLADAVDIFIERFTLHEQGIQLGIVTFASDATLAVPLTPDKVRLKATNTSIIRNRTANGSTDMVGALRIARQSLINSDKLKFVVLITDGLPTMMEATKNMAFKFKDEEIVIFGIYIESGDSDRSGAQFLKEISYLSLSTNYELLAQEINRLDICM